MSPHVRLSSLTLSLLLSACGAGTAGIVAGSGDGGGGNSAPALANLQVPAPKTAPARIVVELTDREGESVPLELSARVPLAGGGLSDPLPLTAVGGPGFPANGAPVAIPGGGQPLALELEWDFPAESFPGWPDDGRYVEGLELRARLGTGAELVLGDDEAFAIGNDAPVVTSAVPVIDPGEGEAAGIVRVVVTVADSSDDVVSVRVEFDVQGDVPDAGWLPATGFGLSDVQVSRDGSVLDYFWDTDTDLRDLEREVALRFTAEDQAPAIGPSLAIAAFRVDNNAAPIVQLDSGPLILNPDERRGIPIPFRVIDEEGDRVEVIFQWRREGEEFPELPRDMAQLDAILADPELRREYRICSEYPRYAQGRVIPIEADTVRLPELASSESWILAGGLEGRTLELLRPSSIPQPITPTWASNPLVFPIAALPVGDGLTALVLDVPGNGRLREIELATGVVVREIATIGPGIPSVMAFERREKAVLVALDDAGTWRIARVELASGALTELIVSDGSQPAPVRGIASLGTHAAVFTAGSSLFHLDYRDPLAPQLGTLLTGLAAPWGVVADPLTIDRLYVSERAANRVLAIELDSHGKLPVVVKTADLQPASLDAPEALALERNGSRMLVLTNAPGGGRALHGLDLGATGGNRSFPIGAPTATGVASVATGRDELRLLCIPSSNELLVAGGVEQRRVIAAHSMSSQDTSVERTFDPAPTQGQPWRVPESTFVDTRAEAVGHSFVWDSIDAFTGSVFIRATARDDELGVAANGAAPKHFSGELEVDPFVLGGFPITDTPNSVAIGDLDGDGDQDLVSANSGSHNLTVFLQESPGGFALPPLVLGGSPITNGPVSVAIGDLDSDGDQDLVSANSASHNLTVFLQESLGSFSLSPIVIGGTLITFNPSSVAISDLDSDGDQDIVSVNSGGFVGQGQLLTFFLQESPGSFASPQVLGGSPIRNGPFQVGTGDLDGDGDQDIVSAGDNLSVFLQSSPGIFDPAPLVLGEKITGDPVSVAIGDLDGDGDQDLVSANRGVFVGEGDFLTIFLQISSGNFDMTPLVLGDFLITNNPWSVAIGDLDGDGDQDVASANAGGHDLSVFRQISAGSFDPAPLVLGGLLITPGPSSIAISDLDGDGDQDVASANAAGHNLTIFSQVSSGLPAGSPTVLGGSGTTDGPDPVAIADLDADGDLDLVSANPGGHDLTVFFQASPGRFVASPFVLGGFPITNSPSSVAAADLDGDGDQDLVSANFSNFSNLTVFFQILPGIFATAPLVLGGPGTTDGPRSITAADLDGDGDQDLVSANAGGDDLTVFLQVSPGNFAASPLVLGDSSTTNSPFSVVAADLDGDGDRDLISANRDSSNLTIFFQNYAGSFASAPLVVGGSGTTDGPPSVAAADLDGDGDLDLVSANLAGNNLTIFFQVSSGSFAIPPLVLGGSGTTDSPRSVAAADLDGDGDQDLVSANLAGSNLTVFLQTSPGSFAISPLVLGGSGRTDSPRSVAAADLDGDGDNDLVSANLVGDNLTIFWGGR